MICAMNKKSGKRTTNRLIQFMLLTANAGAILTVSSSKPINLFSDRLGSVVYAAQTSNTNNISTVTQTPSAAPGATINYSGADVRANSRLLGNSTWTTNNDPQSVNYVQLVPNSSNQFGYQILNTALSTASPFALTGYLNPSSISSNGGDWIGVILAPMDPSSFNPSPSGGGGSLGIQGTPNSWALGLDFYWNSNFQDPGNAAPFADLRWTDTSGSLAGLGNRQNLYTGYGSSNNTNPANYLGGTTIAWTLNYYPTGGPNNGPYLVGTLKGSSGTLTFSTNNTGGDSLPINPLPAYFTVAIDGANGTSTQTMQGSIDSVVTGVAYPSNCTINYYLNGTTTSIAPSTTLTSGAGDFIGLSLNGTPFTAGAIAGTDNWVYDGSVPTNASSAYASGYHLTSAKSSNDGNADLRVNTDSTKNIYNLYYSPDVQQAVLASDSSDPTGSPQTIETANGTTGGTISFTTTDATLQSKASAAGCSYTITGPDGKQYSTLSAAVAANKTYDNTSNGTATTDSAPQNFTVTYNHLFQQAQVTTSTNGGSSSVLATFDSNSDSAPLINKSSKAIETTVNDASLAKTNYTYVVIGPDGNSYPTMAAAVAAAPNNAWDNTNNPVGATTDSTPQVFAVKYTGAVQTYNLIAATPDTSGKLVSSTVESPQGPYGTALSFNSTDASLVQTGFTYTVTGPDGKSYPTLAAALAANPNYDVQSSSNSQNFTVTYAHLFQQVIVTTATNGGDATTLATYDTSNDPYSPLINGTSNALENAVSDASLSRNNYTYVVIGPDGKQYDNMKDAQAANNAWDTTDNSADPTKDSSPQVFKVQYTGVSVNAVLDITSTDGKIADSVKESLTGPFGTAIPFQTTDAGLAQQGYSYTVTGPDGQTYDTLAAAIAANPNYAITSANGSSTDQSPQKYQITYSPENVSVAYNYVDNNGNTIQTSSTSSQVVNSAVDTSNPPTISGYTFDSVASSSDTIVKADGSSSVTYVYKISQDIIDAANTANNTAATSDVSNEQGVKDAETALTNALDSKSATPQSIQNATDALNTAVKNAQDARDAATSAANTAISKATNSPLSSDDGITSAQEALTKVLGDSSSTTDAITKATNDLTDAIEAANDARAQAVSAAQAVIAKTSPISNEQAVLQALTNLQTAINTASSSDTTIKQLTSQLQDALDTASATRTDANNKANDAIASVASNNVGNNTNISYLANELKTVQANAANDQASALSANITDLTNQLNKAISDEVALRATDQQSLKDLITAASPVSNEKAVVTALAEANAALENPNSDSSTLAQAISDLTSATSTAKEDRATAETAANTLIQTAQNSTVDNADPNVQAAITNLQNVMSLADEDSPNDLTADIIAATTALNTAISTSNAENVAATTAAQTLLTQTGPVSNETADGSDVKDAKAALSALVTSGDATTQQLKDATATLQSALDNANAARDAANTAADTAISNAQNSAVANETDIQMAIKNLQTLQGEAASDSSDALTADIAAATKTLTDLTAAETSKRADLLTQAQTAISDASPVSYESDVASDISALSAAIANPDNTNPVITSTQLANMIATLQSDTTSATTARNNTITSANTLISSVSTSPVANETSVQDAITALSDVITQSKTNTASALTADIQEAMNNLTAAQTAAQTARNTANQNAQTAQSNASSSAVSNEQTVKDAQSALTTVLQNNSSTTADIKKATDALNQAVTDATTARTTAQNDANTEMTTAQNSNVGNESAVQTAESNLQKVLDDSNATTQQIEDATTALTQAVSDAQSARSDATTDANTADSNAKSSAVSNEYVVQQAETQLETVLKDPTSTTADIQKATDNLNNVVSSSLSSRNEEIAIASNLKDADNTKPVSYEEGVVSAISNLNTVLGDSSSTIEDIINAVATANNAIAAANTDRTAANTAANNLITSLAESPSAQEPGVVAAENALTTAMNNAATDDPNTLTQQIKDATAALQNAINAATTARTDAASAINTASDSPVKSDQGIVDAVSALNNLLNSPTSSTQSITDATKALNQAISDAASNRASAAADAQNTLGDTAPVSNEKAVADAITNLNTVLADPSSTAADIQSADTALQNALTQANSDRDDANTAADAAIQSASDKGVTNNSTVSGLITQLEQAQSNAANNSPTDLTATITDLTTQLTKAISDETAARSADQQALQQAISDASPVSNESAVAKDIVAAQALLNNPNTDSSDLASALSTLSGDTTTAKNARDNANTVAQTAIDKANSSPVDKADQSVQNAISALQNVMTQAAKDNKDDLTADIIAATNTLNSMLSTSASDYADAVTAAQNLLGQTSPVAYETNAENDSNNADVADAITNLTQVLADQNSSTTQIQVATASLQTALNTAKADRSNADDAATTAIKAANAAKDSNGNTVANEQSVQDAITALQTVMTQAEKQTTDANGNILSLTKDIKAATDALNQAVSDATTARNQALADAKTAQDSSNATQSDANNTYVNNEQAVKDAQTVLANALNKDSSSPTQTADIQKATDALNQAINDATAARQTAQDTANTAMTNAQKSDVGNEPTVQSAESNLQKVLDNPNSTTQQITDATTALNKAVTDAQAARDTATTNAQNAKTNETSSPVDNEQSVLDAQNALNDLLNPPADSTAPAATTQQITDATNALNNAIASETTNRTNATDDANSAIKNAGNSAVSNELSVQNAEDALNNLLNNTDGLNPTTQQIKDATQALNDAVKQANTDRTNATNDALQAIKDASPVANEGATKVAEQILEDTLNNPYSTTEDIQKATDVFNNSIQEVLADKAAAVQAAKDAMAPDKTAPVSHESAVSKAVSDLNDLLKAPSATIASINEAVTALNNAVQNATNERNQTIEAADTLISQVKAGPNGDKVGVLNAIQHLQQAIANSQKDDPTALTQTIKDLMKALEDANSVQDPVATESKAAETPAKATEEKVAEKATPSETHEEKAPAVAPQAPAGLGTSTTRPSVDVHEASATPAPKATPAAPSTPTPTQAPAAVSTATNAPEVVLAEQASAAPEQAPAQNTGGQTQESGPTQKVDTQAKQTTTDKTDNQENALVNDVRQRKYDTTFNSDSKSKTELRPKERD